jgi:hypothetical protein
MGLRARDRLLERNRELVGRGWAAVEAFMQRHDDVFTWYYGSNGRGGWLLDTGGVDRSLCCGVITGLELVEMPHVPQP